MDIYLKAIRSHLRVAHQVALKRRDHLEAKQVGMLLRNNRISHNTVLVELLDELLAIAAHDPEEWYDDTPEVPF